jgi:hypothetical protein
MKWKYISKLKSLLVKYHLTTMREDNFVKKT